MSSKAAALRKVFESGKILRIMGAHNGLGAKLIERSGFDGVWASGLEISTSFCVPDANILTMTENLETARSINDATQLPVICDCDTGYGNASNVKHMVKRYEAAGLAALVIEDKIFPKVNSFIAGGQDLAPLEEFAGRIRAAKEAQSSPELMIFARVEALIAGFGLEEALRRAHAYADAGADGIVIHSKSSSPEEVIAFSRRWGCRLPLVAIPTTYFKVTAEELQREGFSMVIYANQGLRAAIRAMEHTFRAIRESGSTAGVESSLTPMKQVFELQGMTAMREDEEKFAGGEIVQAVIPAARDHRFQPDLSELLKDRPLCMVEVGGKTLLERQMDLLHSVGIADISVVGGHRYEKIKAEGARLFYNPDYQSGNCAQSILVAGDHLKENALIVYSDILFDRRILERLLESPHQITLVIDRAYRSLPARDKALDLVMVEEPDPAAGDRKLEMEVFKRVRRIGKKIGIGAPAREFIGVALFRKKGLAELKTAWKEALEEFRQKPFYEAKSGAQADLTDLLNYLLDRGVPVHGMEVSRGWSEIHSLNDYQRVQAHYQADTILSS